MTKLIEDAREDDDASAKSVDPFRRPRRVDELRQMRALEPPIGEGRYLRQCVDCEVPFKTDDREACLCQPCDAKEAAKYPDDGGILWYQQRRFGRGRSRSDG